MNLGNLLIVGRTRTAKLIFELQLGMKLHEIKVYKRDVQRIISVHFDKTLHKISIQEI